MVRVGVPPQTEALSTHRHDNDIIRNLCVNIPLMPKGVEQFTLHNVA